MKKGSTLFLKLIVILIGLPVLALCILWLPSVVDYLPLLVIVGLYVTAISFFFALFQALKLLNYIDRNESFSELSVHALKNIKLCAIIICIIYVIILPLIYPLADADDAPGLLAIPIVFLFASSVIAVFSSVLERLFKEALNLKSKSDSTL